MTKPQIDQLIHDLFFVGISVASMFVKNPVSQQHAASIITLLNQVALPIADNLLNPPPSPAPPVA